jgi:hypothetical protein
MSRFWIAAAANGKVRVLLGAAALKEKRRIGREIDRTIEKALTGELADSDFGYVERLSALADRLARGKAG